MAWLAGVFDGEGSISVSVEARVRGNSGVSYSTRPALSIGQSDRRLLDAVAVVVGAGRVGGPYPRPKGQPTFDWKLRGVRPVRSLLPEILPWLVVKQERARELLDALGAYDRLMAEPLLDPTRCAKWQKTSSPTRLRLGNRGSGRLAHALLPWLRKWQPETATLRAAEKIAPWGQFVEVDEAELVDKSNEQE